MRKEVLEELSNRINKLKLEATPDKIVTGMSGSFIRFNMAIDSMSAMTHEEFDDGIYSDWLLEQYKNVYNEINQCGA